MLKPFSAWLAAMVVMGMAYAPARAEEPSRRPSAFGPGEHSKYDVAYLGLHAGSAQITIGSETQQWGKEVWPIVTLAKTESLIALFPMKDKFVTYWDHSIQKSIGSDLFADEGRKKRRQRIQLVPDSKAVVLVQKEGGSAEEQTHDVDANALDMAAVAFTLRNSDLQLGREYLLPVFTGVKSFTLQARVEAKQNLKTRLGEREVFKVRIVTDFSGKLASKRDMFAYFTTDPRHLPVRIEAEFLIGTLVAELTEYQQGRDLALKPTVASDG